MVKKEMKTIKINDVDYVPKKEYDKLSKMVDIEEDPKDFYPLDPAYIMLIGKVHEKDDKLKFKFLPAEYIKDNSNIKILLDVSGDQQVLTIEKDGKYHGRISKEYYDKAIKIIDLWERDAELHVQKKPHQPVLIKGDDLGFMLAPRVETDEE